MPANLLRKRGDEDARVTAVELFFDLVFVFAVTQLSHHLLAHLTPAGIGETALMTLGVWWVWIYTSWVTNWLDTGRTSVRLLIFALMAAALVLAMSIPQAWGERGLAFAGAYVFMQVGRSLFMVFAMRVANPVNARNFRRITIWLATSGIFWIAGGLSDGHARLWLWIAALAIEYAGPPLYFYVPGLGRSSSTDWNIQGAHLAERCGLFIIIVLGESIIVTGSTTAGLAWTAMTVTTFAGALLGTVAMWWIYFNIGAERGVHHISAASDTGRYARLVYNYFHLPIVAGILVSAAADELVLMHPLGHLEPLQKALMIGGPALFLIGNHLFKRTTARHGPLSHQIGLGFLAALAAESSYLSPYLLGLGTSVALTIVAIWATVSLSGRSSSELAASA